MTDDDEQRDGRCWGCGYLLRGVESTKCPECGRGFDRSDRASMNFGRPAGRVGRWMVSGIARWPTVLAAAACGLVWAGVRRPAGGWRGSLVDVPYYARAWAWRGRVPGATAAEVAYSAGLWLAAAVAAWWVLRAALRAVGVARYRPHREHRGRFWGRSALLGVLLLGAVVGASLGWQERLGRRWAREYAARDLPYVDAFVPSFAAAGAALSPEDEAAVLRHLVLRGQTRDKVAGLKLLVEQSPPGVALPLLSEAVNAEADASVVGLELHLIGIYRDAAALPLLRRFLDSPDAGVRAAAADAIGIVRRPAFPVYPDSALRAPNGDPIPIRTRTDPAIIVPEPVVPWDTEVDIGAATRARLAAMVAGDVTLAEREAAARALLGATTDAEAHLRYAEWGVFLGDGVGRLQFARAQLDEIPPFVHRVGNPAKELEARIWTSRPNFKPVIHLTAPGPGPLVVRLSVTIASGRPWVAYPRFDDLIADAHGWNGGSFEPYAGSHEMLIVPRSASVVDPPLPPVAFELREGYPWLTPAHRDIEASKLLPDLSAITGLGVTWQTLVVTPTRLAWMRPAVVGADPRFAWWTRLRGVETSWVSSRGQSERFLYYDGPTIRPSPVRVTIKGRRLHWTGDGDGLGEACYVEVAGGAARGVWLTGEEVRRDGAIDVGGPGGRPLAALTPADLLARVTARGLTASEGAGMVDCWKHAFLETPGRRFLLFMSESDYDSACPISVSPAPVERARVGIVLTELGKGQP